MYAAGLGVLWLCHGDTSRVWSVAAVVGVWVAVLAVQGCTCVMHWIPEVMLQDGNDGRIASVNTGVHVSAATADHAEWDAAPDS